MSSPLKSKANSSSLLYRRYLRGLILATVTTLAVVGCDTNKETGSETLIEISEDKVVVDQSLIQTSSPERYQPSYNLQGALIPVFSSEVKSAYPVLEAAIQVKKGDVVKQGQPLAEIKSEVSETLVPFIANEFLDVYVDGKQVPVKADNPLTTRSNNKAKDAQAVNEADKPSSADAAGKETAEDKASANPKKVENEKDKTSEVDETEAPLVTVTLILKSPIDGTITDITEATESKSETETETKTEDSETGSPIITVANTQRLQLEGTLPLSTKSQLSVGKPVYFTVLELQKEFTGQISYISPNPGSNTLTVRAPLVPGENNKALLKPGMQASMQIEYGQIELGVRVPRSAIHEAKLDSLTKKRPRPNSPIKGYVWIVEQDQSLAYTPIEVVQYFADSDQFLVSGISNESIICLADLPKNSAGKKLSVN